MDTFLLTTLGMLITGINMMITGYVVYLYKKMKLYQEDVARVLMELREHEAKVENLMRNKKVNNFFKERMGGIADNKFIDEVSDWAVAEPANRIHSKPYDDMVDSIRELTGIKVIASENVPKGHYIAVDPAMGFENAVYVRPADHDELRRQIGMSELFKPTFYTKKADGVWMKPEIRRMYNRSFVGSKEWKSE